MHFLDLVNGCLFGFFSSSRGLRQNDPSLPFLFVIVMEALSIMLSDIVNGGLLSRFSVGSRHFGVVDISHLLFAGDTGFFFFFFFFCGDKLDHLRFLHALFLYFEDVSDLKINLAKSELVAMGNVENVVGLAGILGCSVSFLPLKYLGLPLGASYKAKYI
jgi:hypothetical protein